MLEGKEIYVLYTSRDQGICLNFYAHSSKGRGCHEKKTCIQLSSVAKKKKHVATRYVGNLANDIMLYDFWLCFSTQFEYKSYKIIRTLTIEYLLTLS